MTSEYEIVGEPITDEDYRELLRTWKDKPGRCKCGAEVPKKHWVCAACQRQKRLKCDVEYKKKRRKVSD
jgi:hypothetical protein